MDSLPAATAKLLNALIGVVHHNGELVGGRVIAAPEHEVVHYAAGLAVEQVVEADRLGLRVEPQRGRPSRALAL